MLMNVVRHEITEANIIVNENGRERTLAIYHKTRVFYDVV